MRAFLLLGLFDAWIISCLGSDSGQTERFNVLLMTSSGSSHQIFSSLPCRTDGNCVHAERFCKDQLSLFSYRQSSLRVLFRTFHSQPNIGRFQRLFVGREPVLPAANLKGNNCHYFILSNRV